jgi:hypothetical protein
VLRPGRFSFLRLQQLPAFALSSSHAFSSHALVKSMPLARPFAVWRGAPLQLCPSSSRSRPTKARRTSISARRLCAAWLELNRREITCAVYTNYCTSWRAFRGAWRLRSVWRRFAAVRKQGDQLCHANSQPASPARWPPRARPTAAAGRQSQQSARGAAISARRRGERWDTAE